MDKRDQQGQINMPKIIGENVRFYRLANDLTQERLAQLASINVRHLQKIEAGEVNLTIITVHRLCVALGVQPESLFKSKGD